MDVSAGAISTNIHRVRECIAGAARRAGRNPDDVTLVAVTKTYSTDAIRMAYDAGVRHFGENRVQEWETKQPVLGDLAATWHLIGHLQSNKIARAVGLFTQIDSVDTVALASKIERSAAGLRRVPILLEVRMDPAPAKTGIDPDELPAVADAILPMAGLELRGLMCVPPQFDAPDQARPYFRRLRELRDALVRRHGIALPELSMGMSHDFEAAIEEGATQVRLGTAVFGHRPHVA
jgi:PLP dependent protein